MGKLNKDQYRYRELSAARKMSNNAEMMESKKVDPEIADLLSKLCYYRHQIHCSIDKMVRKNETDFLEQLIVINSELEEHNFKTMSFCPTDTVDYIDIDDIDLRMTMEDKSLDDDDFQEWFDNTYRELYEQYEELNRNIEKYLSEIDEEFGTNYCPSGALRIM